VQCLMFLCIFCSGRGRFGHRWTQLNVCSVREQVYVVDNYQRRAINSVALFYKYGFDFADVRVSIRPGEVDLLPEGPALV
jgi:hypothetical protein